MVTYLWKSWVHLFLSFKVGGLYPDFDIKNKALIGCKSNIGGCSSANSMAVIPTAQISQRWLYPPFLSTAATWNVNKVNVVNKQLTSSKYSYKLWKIASSKMLIVLLLETLSNAGFLVQPSRSTILPKLFFFRKPAWLTQIFVSITYSLILKVW